jgi:hypothetical protein
MDKLKIIFADLKKYQFWILCGAVLVVSLVCWWLATNGAAEQFQTRKAAIERSFTAATVPPDPPNDKKIKAVGELTESLKRGKSGVFPAWEILYARQQEKNSFPKVLGDRFGEAFNKLSPGGELDSQYREIYQNSIKTYLPSLRDIIRALRPLGPAGAPGHLPPGAGLASETASPSASPEERWTGIVEWDESNFRKLEDRLKWDATPSTLAVVLAQEDLWVYEALLKAIARTNEGATNQSNAVVKRIEDLEIGPPAADAWKSAATALGLGAQAGGAGSTRGTTARPGSGTSSEEQERRQLIENRYLDDKGMPLPLDTSSPLYARHPFAEFKIMPVFMKLAIDQQRLPKLLVECANSNMPIAVRLIRIHNTEGAASGAGSTSGTSVGHPTTGGKALSPQESGQSELSVDIFANIYIFNPPNREKLGTGMPSPATAGPGPAAAPKKTPSRARK